MQLTVSSITPCSNGNSMITFESLSEVPGVGTVSSGKMYFYVTNPTCQVNDEVNLDMSKFDIVKKEGKNREGIECTFKVLELKL